MLLLFTVARVVMVLSGCRGSSGLFRCFFYKFFRMKNGTYPYAPFLKTN